MNVLSNFLKSPTGTSLLEKAHQTQTSINARVDGFLDRNPTVVNVVGEAISKVRAAFDSIK